MYGYPSIVPQCPIPDLLRFGQEAVQKTLTDFPASEAGFLLAVDATCGNGHDACFLAAVLRRCHAKRPYGVLAFDVQESALRCAKELLTKRGLADTVECLLQDHAVLGAELLRRQKAAGSPIILAAVMYNLGFLPRSDKRLVTRKESTLASLEAAARFLAPHGILSVHAYGGHSGGREELEAVESWCAALPFKLWTVARYSMCNKLRRPEALFLAQRRISNV